MRRGEGRGGSRVLSVQSTGLSRLSVEVCLRNCQNKSFIACLVFRSAVMLPSHIYEIFNVTELISSYQNIQNNK